MREMRRKDKEIGTDEAINLLSECEYGVLSTVGDDGLPYGIPLNYAYKDNCIYFHCALKGHKIDNIDNNPKVSFCAVGETKVLPSEFSTNYVTKRLHHVPMESGMIFQISETMFFHHSSMPYTL